ncbi:actin 3 [Mortierella sp. GBAus27b]|nr:actin 3 [Mortierella sp. GBAus27b]
MYENTAIVIDNGSAMLKAGFAGDDIPHTTFPTVTGSPTTIPRGSLRGVVVGNEARSKPGLLSLDSPIKYGNITNWDRMERIWDHTFYNELCVVPEDHPVLLTQTHYNTSQNRRRMVEIMFETFKCPAYLDYNQAVLSLYASGRTTGIVLDSGLDITQAVPIYEGYAIPSAIRRLDFGGRALTDLLQQSIFECHLLRLKHVRTVRDIKEKHCYVAQDYQLELDEAQHLTNANENYKLPDGTHIAIGEPRFHAPEALFQPSMIGMKDEGIHELLANAVKSCAVDIRCSMYSNIVLAGGNTMFPNIDGRLYKELSIIATSRRNLTIVAPPERKYSAWIGGSVVASLSTFQNACISRQDYFEYGPSVVHRDP